MVNIIVGTRAIGDGSKARAGSHYGSGSGLKKDEAPFSSDFGSGSATLYKKLLSSLRSLLYLNFKSLAVFSYHSMQTR
jgi:hypothetical protein